MRPSVGERFCSIRQVLLLTPTKDGNVIMILGDTAALQRTRILLLSEKIYECQNMMILKEYTNK